MKKPAFTLTELLVVMGVIAVLATLTLVSARAITGGARIASGTNAVTSALDNARALAMRRNGWVIVVFRPRLDRNGTDQVVEIVTARWSGQSFVNPSLGVIDRFVPVPDVPIRELPSGINVAAPRYEAAADGTQDDAWVTQSYLPATDSSNNPNIGTPEVSGAMIGVMYGPEGTTISRISQSDGDRVWVDFQQDPSLPLTVRLQGTEMLPADLNPVQAYWSRFADDETLVTVAPFLAVYDDRDARKQHAGDWTIGQEYEAELTGPQGYITRNGARVHFNRYTGVVMR